LFIFKLSEDTDRRSPQRKAVINKIGNIDRQGDSIREKVNRVQHFPVSRMKAKREGQNHHGDEKRIRIQNSCQIKPQSSEQDAQKPRIVMPGKKSMLKK